MACYVVEHLDDELFEWSRCGMICLSPFCYNALRIEYFSLLDFVKPSLVYFTNASFVTPDSWKSFQNIKIFSSSVTGLGLPIENVCLLDSEAPDALQPSDALNFSYFLFGGILGNSTRYNYDNLQCV